MEDQVEAVTSRIQGRDEDRNDSHRCHEKWSASEYIIHLLKPVIPEFVIEEYPSECQRMMCIIFPGRRGSLLQDPYHSVL